MIWSFLMPLLCALTAAFLVAGSLSSAGRLTQREILRSGEVLLTDKELQRQRDGRGMSCVIKMINLLGKYVDLDQLVFSEMERMLFTLNRKRSPERELAHFIVSGLIGASPVLLVPLFTGCSSYIFLYPCFCMLLIYRQYNNLRNSYKEWQLALIKDIPNLIDKLRISFASGRDYIASLSQARNSSGPEMRIALDNLITDMQYMRPGQALDIFSSGIKMPIVSKFASAVKIAVEYGYEAAENYFQIIEEDIVDVRRVAVEELTKAKPEKVKMLYIVLIALAAGSLVLKGWEVVLQLQKII